MQTRTISKILITIMFMLIMIIPSASFATGTTTITPSDITGTEIDIKDELSSLDTITKAVQTIGMFIAVGALMVIGIKYMMGSLEEKANYKKSMIPYIIGCFILFGASVLAPTLIESFENLGGDEAEIGNSVLGILQAVGSFIAVGVLMVIGIKYLVGSVEERAEYKKTMMPYLIGAILIFAAVNLTKIIYDVTIDSVGKVYSAEQGQADAESYLKEHSHEEILQKQTEAESEMLAEKEKNGTNSDKYKYWYSYVSRMQESTRWWK